MTSVVTCCPDQERLQAHLEGLLHDDQEAGLIAHLDSCQSCRETLEGLAAAGPGLWEMASKLTPNLDLPQPALPEPPLEDWLRGLLDGPGQAGVLGVVGRYEILEIIGRGGMGVVLKARDLQLHRLVAVKVPAPCLMNNEKARERFIREARAAAAIRHEHVACVYGVEESKGVPFLVMELISGQSLQKRIDAEGPLPPKEVVNIGRQVALGLAAAHAHGLIHRDIKPANILLEERTGRAVITDFGLARAIDDASLSETGIVAGTPDYMAPEQAQGARSDHRADLFSLGGVLYAMGAGRRPFPASNTLAVLKQICDEPPRPLRELNPKIPGWLAAIVAQLQAKDPGERMQSAGEVADVLAQCLDHLQQPEKTALPRLATKLRRTWPRHRWVAVAGVALLLAGATVALPEIIIRIRDKDGRTTELKVGAGAKVEIVEDGKITAVAPKPTGELQCFRGHRDVIWSVAIAPDARRVVSASADSTVRVWDAQSGKELQRFEGHDHCVYTAAISPDGRRVLSGSGWKPIDNAGQSRWNVCLWDLESGKELQRLTGNGGGITSVALAADGQRALIANYDGTVLLWDVDAWKQIKRFDLKFGIWSVCFSSSGRHALASGGFDNKAHVQLFDLESGSTLTRFEGHEFGTWQAVFTSDAKQVLTAGLDGSVRLWNAENGSQLRRFSAPVSSIALSGDNRLLLVGNSPSLGKVRWLNIETGVDVQVFEGHTGGVRCVALCNQHRRAVSGSYDRTVRLWQLPK